MRLTVVAVWLLASQANADNFTNTWDSSGSSFASPVDGSGDWSTTATDWSNGSADVAWPAPAPTAYTAVFGNGGAAGTVTITSPVVAAGLTFNSVVSGNYTIVSSGPSDTLTLSLPTTITVGSGLSPTINATITGTSGLVVAGADTSAALSLGGSNTYTGGTNLQSGNLAITSDAAINNGVGGIAFNGGNLQFNNYPSNLSFSNDQSLNLGAAPGAASTLSGNITGLTYLTYFGPGTLILNGTNTYSGNTYVANGTLVAGNVGALPAGHPIYFYVGATLAIDSDADIGNSTSGLNFVSGGTLQFNNYASNLSFDNIANLGLGAAAGTASTLHGTITVSSGLTYVGPGTLTLTGALTLGSNSSLTVNSGTLAFNVNGSAPATVGTGVTATVAGGATLQLAGPVSALSDTNSGNVANVITHGTFQFDATDGALSVVGATSQTVGTVIGDSATNGDGATVYAGNTTVGDGTNAASLTATQILQNTLTIGAGSTVTIAPSDGGVMAVTNAGASNASATAASSTADSSRDSSRDPLMSIQAAIDLGSISSAKGRQLENRIAAIERLATTDPGLDVSLLESRILAALPTSSILPSTDSAPLGDSGSGLLAVDNSAFGSSSSGVGAAFAGGPSVGGSPAAVPEPSTLLLATVGGIALALTVCRRTSRLRSEQLARR